VTVHRRSYHLHAHEASSERGVVRWSVYRAYHVTGRPVLSVLLARGDLDLTVDEATPQWTAEALLTATLAAFRARILRDADDEAELPEDTP
jgi:hypothetical protein